MLDGPRMPARDRGPDRRRQLAPALAAAEPALALVAAAGVGLDVLLPAGARAVAHALSILVAVQAALATALALVLLLLPALALGTNALALPALALVAHALTLTNSGLDSEGNTYTDSTEVTGAFTGSDQPLRFYSDTFNHDLVLNAQVQATGDDLNGVDLSYAGDDDNPSSIGAPTEVFGNLRKGDKIVVNARNDLRQGMRVVAN